jgi:hypothetical protein
VWWLARSPACAVKAAPAGKCNERSHREEGGKHQELRQEQHVTPNKKTNQGQERQVPATSNNNHKQQLRQPNNNGNNNENSNSSNSHDRNTDE